MKIKFGSIVTDGRGKLGGHVYSKNRGGNYIRTNIIPTNPQTAAQMEARGLFGSISTAWRSLEEDEREQWRAFAKDNTYQDIFGDAKELTGNSAFVRSNMNLSSGGQAPITAPFDADEDLRFSEIQLGLMTDGMGDIQTSEYFIEAVTFNKTRMGDASVVVYATAPFPASQTFAKNRFRVLKSVQAAQLTNEINFKTEYLARYGLPEPGLRIAVKVALVKTNGLSSLVWGGDGIVEEV